MYGGYDVVSVGNDTMSVGYGIFGACNVLADSGNCYVGVYREFGLETVSQQRLRKSEGTDVKDVEDPVEVQSPGGNRVFIVLREENARNLVSLALFDCFLLNFCHGPVVKRVVRQPPKRYVGESNPRRQLVNRLTHGPTEIAQLLPVRSPIKCFTDVGAVESKLDVILFVNNRFLVEC